MSTSNEKHKGKTSFFKELMSRRVLQILGIYLGVSWGIVQFIDWLANRYLWSPNLTDLAIVALLSLIPTAIIMAYFHGSPGRNKWTRTEKFFIPLNFICAITLLVFVFSGKDLGSITKTLTMEDESGKKIQKIIPKKGFRKRIALFNFSNKTGDPNIDWLQDGIPFLIIMDLSQDIFINAQGAQTSPPFYATMKKNGFAHRKNPPLTLQRKISKEYHLDYFLNGSFGKNNHQLQVEFSLYETKRGKLIEKRTFTGTNIFELTDQLTIQLKKDLKIPGHHIESSDDLPISEILTQSKEAYKNCVHGSNELLFNLNYIAAEKYFEKCLKIDPTFTLVHYLQGLVSANLNETKKSISFLESAMKYLYKLPDNFKFRVKTTYYVMKNEASKILKLSKMQVDLFPEDISAHESLASFYRQQNQYDLAIAQYQKILELSVNPYIHYHKLAQLYMKKGNKTKALKLYQEYAQKYPDEMISFKELGEFFEKFGDYKKAISNYEKALLLDTGNISLMMAIANVQNNLGKFSESLNTYEKALKQSQSPQERSSIYSNLMGYFSQKGQLKKSLQYYRLYFKELEKFQPPFNLMLTKLLRTNRFVSAGQLEEAREVIKTIGSQLKPPFDKLIVFGSVSIYLELQDIPNLEKCLLEINEAIKTFGATIGGARSFYYQVEGETRELKGEYQKAITSFQNYYTLNPTDVTAYLDIGRCYRKLKDYKKAETYLKKCIAVHPYGPKTNHELALIYAEIGKVEESIKHLKVALDIWKDADPGFKSAQEARKKLNELISAE